MPQEAAELAYRFIDASYRSTDSRELDEYGGLPGVTREYRHTITKGKWGEIDYANAGIEGYGWGALSIHLLIWPVCYKPRYHRPGSNTATGPASPRRNLYCHAHSLGEGTWGEERTFQLDH
jgi:hypothetical protein